VPDAEKRFADDFYVVLKKKVEVLEYGTRKTIFDRNNSGINGLLNEFFEDIGREGAGHDDAFSNETERRLMAEGTRLSLNSNSHWQDFLRGFAGRIVYFLSQISAATKTRNTVAMTPFMVKKAALSRRRS